MPAATAAFTLLELMTVIAIISILSVMVMGVTMDLRKRADRAKCVSNLKNLYAAASAYIQQEGHWPQIDSRLLQNQEKDYARGWVEALKPFGLAHANWLCPTTQRELRDPDMNDPRNMRIDYLANPFDDRPTSPYQFPGQPWFAERGSVHADGNLIIFTSGQVKSMLEIARERRR